jgi:hypothetical protein
MRRCTVRTTIRLSDSVLREAKRYAAEHGATLNSLVEQSLRERLSGTSRKVSAPRVVLNTFRGNGLRPGVDLDDTAGLLDRMNSQ